MQTPRSEGEGNRTANSTAATVAAASNDTESVVRWCPIVSESVPWLLRIFSERRVPPSPLSDRLTQDCLELIQNFVFRCLVDTSLERDALQTARQLLKTPSLIRKPSVEVRRFVKLLLLRASRQHCTYHGRELPICKADSRNIPFDKARTSNSTQSTRGSGQIQKKRKNNSTQRDGFSRKTRRNWKTSQCEWNFCATSHRLKSHNRVWWCGEVCGGFAVACWLQTRHQWWWRSCSRIKFTSYLDWCRWSCCAWTEWLEYCIWFQWFLWQMDSSRSVSLSSQFKKPLICERTVFLMC